jgi:imidazolonepropionase
MEKLAPLGPVYQAGTLSGNPVATACGLSTLREIQRPGFWEALSQRTRTLVDGLSDAAREAGLPVKLHAEQLSDQDGAALAAEFGALSADHLEWLSPRGIGAMAAAGTVAVLLPGAYYALRETKLPPVDALRRAGVPIAVSTDCNPGTSPTTSPLLMLNMACTLFRLTPLEAVRGLTCVAAPALRLRADVAVYAVSEPAELAWRFGGNPCLGTLRGGVPCFAVEP